MTILLTGASGFIGQHLLIALIQSGHNVIACCRNPSPLQTRFPQIQTLTANFVTMTAISDWQPHLQAIDVVINAVGIITEGRTQTFEKIHSDAATALFQACENSAVRVIQISALDTDTGTPTRYHASKGEADKFLRSLTTEWVIFKPSIVYGPGAKSFGFFKALAGLPMMVLPDKGKQIIQPVYIDDLVAAILQCLESRTAPGQVIAAVGPTAIAFVDFLSQLRRWLGKTETTIVTLPAWTTSLATPIGKILDEPALNNDTLKMLQSGNSANPEPFSKLLGRPPQEFNDVLQKNLATQAERWHASLYFLRPFLRYAIALTWLWAGWVSALVYPPEESYQLLAQVGVGRSLAPFVLYGAAAFDFLLGLAMLQGKKMRQIIWAQITLMLAYSIVITFYLPEFWLHPFGPMIKNLPLLVSLLILLVLEEEKA